MSRTMVSLVLAVLALSACASRSPADRHDAVLAADVESYVAKLTEAGEFSGAVLLAHHARPLVRQGYGMADRDAGRPNTPETPFMLSSVSKMFTAVEIAKLVERNQLSFDSTLGSILPEYPSADAREHVTVHHLLTMSSGIPDLFRVSQFWANIGSLRTATDMWKYFAASPLEFRPGAQMSYSNSNFLLLGSIIERRTGRPFTTVIEDDILGPLGLANTRYRLGAALKPALGYTRTAPGGGNADPVRWYPAWKEPKPGDEFLAANPMGGGYSTVDDLARFADAFVAGRVVSKEMTARMLAGYVDSDYGGRDGYGFETRIINGVRSAGHRGTLAGSTNQVEFFPDIGYVLVVLGNTDSNGTNAIATHVRSLLTSTTKP